MKLRRGQGPQSRLVAPSIFGYMYHVSIRCRCRHGSSAKRKLRDDSISYQMTLSYSIWKCSLSVCRTRTPCYQNLPFTSSGRRGLATKVSQTVTDEVTKSKPKAATQLRRAAAASLPIRANPTPTRSEIHPVSILTTAERFLLPQLRQRLPTSALPLHSAWWLPRWAGLNGKEGEIFIFGNGTLVCWGLEETDARKFAKDFITSTFAESNHLKEAETEDIEFVTDPTEYVRLISIPTTNNLLAH